MRRRADGRQYLTWEWLAMGLLGILCFLAAQAWIDLREHERTTRRDMERIRLRLCLLEKGGSDCLAIP